MTTNHSFSKINQLIHGRQGNKDLESRSHAFPIYQTSTFRFDTVEQGMEIFSGTTKYDAYSRISNPNHRFLEESLSVVEEGETAQVFDSGMTAIKVALFSLLKSGDEVVAHRNLYGGTTRFLNDLHNFGIKITFVDACQNKNIINRLTQKTKIVFLETPSNPVMDICDFERLKVTMETIGRGDILIIVDNTFASPCNQKPLTKGADISIQSLTKYINGFGNATGGAIITSSKIMERIWERYHGSGGMMEPEVAQRIALNMITLPDRMKRHNQNGYDIASGFLKSQPMVQKIYYPGLFDHPNYKIAERLMTGFSGIISFELNDVGGHKTKTFLNKLAQDHKDGEGIITLAVSLGCVDTLICCPALSTHYSLPREERLAQGISDNLIRLSVGIENVDDIIYSLKRGFRAIS